MERERETGVMGRIAVRVCAQAWPWAWVMLAIAVTAGDKPLAIIHGSSGHLHEAHDHQFMVTPRTMPEVTPNVTTARMIHRTIRWPLQHDGSGI